jgi:hypothetical protein
MQGRSTQQLAGAAGSSSQQPFLSSVLVELVFALLAGHDSGPGTPERDDFSSNHHPALFFV